MHRADRLYLLDLGVHCLADWAVSLVGFLRFLFVLWVDTQILGFWVLEKCGVFVVDFTDLTGFQPIWVNWAPNALKFLPHEFFLRVITFLWDAWNFGHHWVIQMLPLIFKRALTKFIFDFLKVFVHFARWRAHVFMRLPSLGLARVETVSKTHFVHHSCRDQHWGYTNPFFGQRF